MCNTVSLKLASFADVLWAFIPAHQRLLYGGISYSVEQTLEGGNKSPQDVCEGG